MKKPTAKGPTGVLVDELARAESEIEESEVLAAIDIGTNSIHLVVARTLPDGGFDVITTSKEMVRLGEGVGPRKELSPEAIDRGIDALTRMAAVAASHSARIVAVATSATREAPNRQVFLERARQQTGVEIEVISGIEEARLIHLGVLQALPVFEKRILLIDIGGGSTEFLVGEGGNVIDARSQKLGAVRLTEEFFPKGVATAKAIRACAEHVAAALVPVSRMLDGLDRAPESAIGSSGTISAVAAVAAARRDGQGDADRFTKAELDEIVDALIDTDATDRSKVDGLDERRVDIIVGGAVLLQQIFKAFEITEMQVSPYALREGVLYDRIEAGAGHERLIDLRRSNVMRLATQLDPDAEHAQTAARLALEIFDQTKERHGLGAGARELLELAAIVHNVGLFISHSAHHKHTYYVVRHSEQLTGFTERERELLALVARYHRKSHPKSRHSEFSALSKSDQELVRKLAGILRVAIGLDRSHRSLVKHIKVKVGSKRMSLRPIPSSGIDLDLEIYAATQRSDLLADAFDIKVIIETA